MNKTMYVASSICGWVGLGLIAAGCWIVDPAVSLIVTGILLLGLTLIGFARGRL